MRWRFLQALATICVAVIHLSCSQNSQPLSADAAVQVADNSAFGLDLYGQLRTKPGNLFYSPYIVSMALGMAHGGAGGETKSQMEQVMRLRLPPERISPAFGKLMDSMRQLQKGGKVQIEAANSLWCQTGTDLLPEYLDVCNFFFGSSATSADFKGDTRLASQKINSWVEKETHGKINDLISPDSVNASTRLLLVTAIYFSGKWSTEFKPSSTSPGPFHLAADREISVPLMRQSHTFQYAAGDDVQVISLPYRGNSVSMVIFLPRKTDGLAAMEAVFDTNYVSGWVSRLKAEYVQLSLPKFKISSEIQLAEQLKIMGMTNAFMETKADFSSITRQKGFFIRELVHKAIVDVNEEGTVAAAATKSDTATAVPMSQIFRVDHPFVFMIRDNQNGNLLFVGRVMDPTK